MSLTLFIHAGASGNVVLLPFANLNTQGIFGTIFSGLVFGSDGNIKKLQANGTETNVGAWLLSGSAGDFTLVSTIDSGSLTADAGRSVTMGSDRAFNVQQSVDGTKLATVTYDIELTASPGVSLVNRSYNFRAVRGAEE